LHFGLADLVELRHDNVKRSIETLVDKSIIQLPQIEGYAIINGLGITTHGTEYLIGKRDSYIIVAQLSPEFTARLVDRWQELEQGAFAIPKTLSGALRLAAEQAETIEAQMLQLEAQKPAAAFVERYVEAKSSKCLSDVAKILGRKPQEFIAELAADGVIFKRAGSWIPYQHQIDNERFTVQTVESNGHAFHQCRVAPVGIAWLAQKYGVKVG
jgi:phage antirepressor YoqD-like protein